jgi:hypothetical protein
MKRKLIDYDAFNKIKTESLSSAQKELEAASNLLAVTLEMDGLSLSSFGTDEVLFESLDGGFIHANYEIKNGHVQFDNVEQLVINEESETAGAKEIISKMIDSLIESNTAKADEIFAEWMDLPRTKRIFTEAKVKRVVCRKGDECKVVRWNDKPKHNEPSSKTKGRVRGKIISNRKTPKGIKMARKAKRARLNRSIGKKMMKEWNMIAENVLGYVDYTQNGPVVNQCSVLRKDNEIVSVRVPTMRLRNEAKLLKFNWDTMNTDVVVKRGNGKKINENNEFVKDIVELKRANALSDNKTFGELLESISTKYSDCVYLTESELAHQINLCLEAASANNYDDETCRFLAEGILRTIHENFVDRVAKIVKLAGSRINEEAADKYTEFKAIAESFYKKLDEHKVLEMQAFVDVYEALRQVHQLAKEENNEIVAEEASIQLDSLLPIIKGEAELSADVLGEAAETLYDIVESTMPEEWNVSEPVVTADGQHPDLTKKGKMSQSPAEMQGSTPNAHFVSDGKEYKGSAASELGNDGWSNLSGEGIYPELDNPYVPKAGEYKIANEKDVDSDSGQLAHWGDADTWPNLQNPYCKDSVTPKSVKE